jgi:hypothetical protein
MKLQQLASAQKFLGRVTLNASEVNEFSMLMNALNTEVDTASKQVIAEHAAANAIKDSPAETVHGAVKVALKVA